MATAQQVEDIKANAAIVGKQHETIARLGELLAHIERERLFAAVMPCLAQGHDLWRVLNQAVRELSSIRASLRAEALDETSAVNSRA